MSSIVPRKPLERLAWYQARLATWTANSAAIGTSAPDVADLTTKATAAQDARSAQVLALAAAKTATEAFYASIGAMSLKGASIVKQVRAKGEATGDPQVYELAMIPAPATPAPVPPPGMPSGFVATLLPNGSLELGWKCNNPVGSSGTLYHVYRRTSTTAEWVFIGGTGDKKFVDTTVPAAMPNLFYQVQAARSTSVGVANEFIVNFGVSATGVMTASVSQEPVKLAA